MNTSIHPACALCKGGCCEKFALNPAAWQWPADITRWLEFHGAPSAFGIVFNCRCDKLVDGKCSIYSNRPQMCQDDAVGSLNCRISIHENRLAQEAELTRLLGLDVVWRRNTRPDSNSAGMGWGLFTIESSRTKSVGMVGLGGHWLA